MQFNKSLLTILFLLSFSAAVFAQAEEYGIKTTLDNYLDGGTSGDTARFNRAFIPQAIQRSVGKDGKIAQMTVKELSTRIKPGERLNRTTRIISWTYAGTAASAVTETEYETSKLIDLLNLLKINGEWKIVSRVFSRIDKGINVSSSNPVMSSPVPNSTGKTNSPAATTTKAKPAAKPKPSSDDGW